MTDTAEGTVVAKGKHVVPKGVAVEELENYDGHEKLQRECPPTLMALLEKKGLVETYDKMVKAVAEEIHTRSRRGKWKDMEFVAVIEAFRDDFCEKGVKVALCKRSSGYSGVNRWLEFIDVDEVDNYVPQFDVANLSGQVIRTVYTTLEFPYGVAVEQFKFWKGRKRLKEKIPVFVEKLMVDKDLMAEYNALVDHFVEYNKRDWNSIDKLKSILAAHAYKFEAKGVAVFIAHKQEYISHGPYGGHYEYYRWIEFVDREEQPNYHPQRDAESKAEKGCVIA